MSRLYCIWSNKCWLEHWMDPRTKWTGAL